MDNGGLIHSNCQHAIIVHKKIDAGKMNEWFTFARVNFVVDYLRVKFEAENLESHLRMIHSFIFCFIVI
ncbi:MAG: hypothetical protein ACI90V_000055 [Bacillariaceae sp.]|jgi:hypothetical protein